MKKIISLILTAIILCTLLISCDSGKSDVQAVKDAGKIVVGVTVYPPMDYLDENGEWTGFDAELAQQFAETLGVNCQIVIIKWDSKLFAGRYWHLYPVSLLADTYNLTANNVSVRLHRLRERLRTHLTERGFQI